MEITIKKLNDFLQVDSTTGRDENFEIVETTTDNRYIIELRKNGSLISVNSCDYDHSSSQMINVEKVKENFILGLILKGIYKVVDESQFLIGSNREAVLTLERHESEEIRNTDRQFGKELGLKTFKEILVQKSIILDESSIHLYYDNIINAKLK